MLARSQLRIIIVASLAGLLFGFDTAVISGVTQELRVTFSLSPAGLGIAVSTALWGTLFGALTMGKLGDRVGSREALKFIGALYLLAALGCALAWSLPSFLVSRFLIGVAIGGSSVLAPVYIAEASPAERRGALVGLFQINIVVGILVAYTSNSCSAAGRRRAPVALETGDSRSSGTGISAAAIFHPAKSAMADPSRAAGRGSRESQAPRQWRSGRRHRTYPRG